MSAYTEDLKFMFNDTNPIRPYYVDKLLRDYTGNATVFATNLPLEDYYVGVLPNIAIENELNDNIYAYMQATGGGMFAAPAEKTLATNAMAQTAIAAAADPLNSPACRAPPAQTGPAPDLAGQLRSNAIEGDPDMYFYNLKVVSNKDRNEVINTKRALMTKLASEVEAQAARDTAGTNLSYADYVSRSHTTFYSYLNTINSTIALHAFLGALKLIDGRPKTQFAQRDPIKLAMEKDIDAIRVASIDKLARMGVSEVNANLTVLRKVCREALGVMAMNMSVDDGSRFIAAFASRATMTTEANKDQYYRLRAIMIDRFKFDPNTVVEPDRKRYSYMVKIIVDLFIKMCYPLIHYDFIDILQQKYTSTGDFVNARYAMLAKVLFTYNLVNVLVSGLTPIPDSVAKDLTTNIYNYIVKNNKGSLNAAGTRQDVMKNIVIELHKISNEVYKKSELNQILVNTIAANQLTMRSLISTNQTFEKDVGKTAIYFYITMAILLTFTAVCGVLMFLDMVDAAVMTAAVSVAAVVLYKLLMMIVSFIRKN